MPVLYVNLFNPLHNSMRQVLLFSFDKWEMNPRESEKPARHPVGEPCLRHGETMDVKCLAYRDNSIPQKLATVLIPRRGVGEELSLGPPEAKSPASTHSSYQLPSAPLLLRHSILTSPLPPTSPSLSPSYPRGSCQWER